MDVNEELKQYVIKLATGRTAAGDENRIRQIGEALSRELPVPEAPAPSPVVTEAPVAAPPAPAVKAAKKPVSKPVSKLSKKK